MRLSVAAASGLLSPTPSSAEDSGAGVGLERMWRDINNRDAKISASEKMMDKISDTAGALGIASLSIK